ncbi:unnamed protein product [Alternaria alternata]
MRLINCSTLQLEEFFGHNIPRYAILSHTWGDEEVSFADFVSSQSTKSISVPDRIGRSDSVTMIRSVMDRSGYQKVLFTCRQAISDGLDYAWIDTCCIDKSSSAELSEAINSMFTWYKNSTCCYAYLSDVSKARIEIEFPRSRWFTRGWTLQELLAPDNLIFYDQQWCHLGTKFEQEEWISKITGIDEMAISEREIHGRKIGLSTFCVAKKMSWASARQTTRVEDIAYCLLGIFDINMPLLYGEGDRAFLRLQEEIIRKIDDDSILAWGLSPTMDHSLGLISDAVRNTMSEAVHSNNILARSPKDFVNCGNLGYTAPSTSPFRLTNVGLQIELPLVPVFQTRDPFGVDNHRGWIGLLSCSTGPSLGFLGILLHPVGRDGTGVRVRRARHRTSEHFYDTLVIGSRGTVGSALQTVTITESDKSYRFQGPTGGYQSSRSYRQILINESKTLQNIGYHVKSGTAWKTIWHGELMHDSNTIWDSDQMVLTTEYRKSFQDLIGFCFELPSSENARKFTVFVCTPSHRAMVLGGDNLSEAARRDIYVDLQLPNSQYDIEDLEIHDKEGECFRVSVSVRPSMVYNHRLFELDIDADQDEI